MKRYILKILGLCETRWKDNGNHITDDGHQLFYSGETKYYRNGVGFMINVVICYRLSLCSCLFGYDAKPHPLYVSLDDTCFLVLDTN